ncbi:carbohydrate deacetylase-like [Haliotis rubra]|uniref:carbohydrate deacetylase-like n=1 Tax=Haliotis rubra TaxID=36100 RepID=UPI001EE519FB|nr:carbohydrate deacetylase-like [Haliotis rubra]
MKLLVITGDDLGYSKERNEGLVHCFRKGAITHTSLMVNGVAAEHGVMMCKKYSVPMGLHFNISEGVPVSEATKSSSLVDKEGIFLEKQSFWKAANDGNLDIKDVKVELEAQLTKFEELVGHPPIHVDGHQHSHIFPSTRKAFAEALGSRGIRSTRLPIDPVILSGDWIPSKYFDSFKLIIELSRQSLPVFRQNGIRVSDCFFGLCTMGYDMTVDRLKTGLIKAYESVDSGGDNSVCELMVHPGYMNGEVGGCGTGPDDFSQSEEREHEINVLSDKSLQAFYSQEQIKLVPFSECWQ